MYFFGKINITVKQIFFQTEDTELMSLFLLNAHKDFVVDIMLTEEWDFPVTQMVKTLPEIQETWV